MKGDLIKVYLKNFICKACRHLLNFITLICKIKEASDIKDYRPLSLIKGTYKVASKQN